ncbi:MAG: hypothetical protein KKB37_11375 [Alphaproteobacteria bacterium]|nr:hypothetical protein [Alphaproteobacteria bacterium]
MTDPTPEEIAAQRAADHLSATKNDTNEELILFINGMTTNTLRMWPEGEVQSWTIQRTEALAVLAAGASATLDMAPFLTKVCVAQFGDATDAERLVQLQEKAAIVKGYADAWENMEAYLNGLRARTQDAIGEASDPIEITAIVNAAKAEAASVLSGQ